MANKDVDTRIVEMQFDAKDFDKGIKQSTKNLEDFKKELNFDDGIKQMADVVGQSAPMNRAILDMAKNIGKLATEFTGLGSVSTFIAQKVKNAWEGAANSVERFVKSMTSDQIRAGSDKYDRLLKSVQTIMNATGESEENVYGVMGKLNKYTDETSYNFADMSENIGKFTTVGIKLKDAEEAMEGIANWAALAGQNATTASRAMFNISQAMSADAMQKLDWKSIQNASMDTRQFRDEAIKAGVAVGTLVKKGDKFFTKKGNKEVNLDNFVETLKFKWFDKATMMQVFKTFADSSQGIGEAAYKAAQRCTTFNDALGAWKDMLSTGWMQSYEHVFGKLSQAMDLFSGICNKVSEQLAKFIELRNGLLKHWNIGGGRDSLWSALVGEFETPDGKTMFAGAYGILDTFKDLSDSFYEAFSNFAIRFANDNQKELFKSDPEYIFAFLGGKLRQFTRSIQEFAQSVGDFLHSAPEGATMTRLEMITKVVESIFAAISLVWQGLRGISALVGDVLKQLRPTFDAILELFTYFASVFTNDIETITKKNSIGVFFQSLLSVIRPATRVINFLAQTIAALITGIVELARQTGIFKIIGDAFQALFNGLMTKLAQFIDSGIIQMLIGWIVKAVSKIPALITQIKNLVSAFASSVKGNQKLQAFFSTIRDLFSLKNLKSLLVSMKNWAKQLFKQIPQMFSTAGAGVGGFFKSLMDGFLGLFIGTAKTEGAQSEIAEAIAKPIADLAKGDVVEKAIDNAAPGILARLKAKVEEIWTNITEFFNALANSEAFEGVKTFFANVKKFFSGTTFMSLLGGLKELMKYASIFRVGSGIGQFGKGLKSIGKGVKVFGKNLKHLDKLNLSNIFSNMFNISNIINSNNTDSSVHKSWDFGNIGPQLLEIAAAIGILVFAAKEIIAMKQEDMERAGIGLGVLLTGLLAASAIAKRLAGNGLSLLAIAAALWLIIKPMQMLMSIPWMGKNGIGGGLIEMVGKLGLVMLSLAVAARLAGNVKIKGLVGMAIALNLLLIPLKILGNMPMVDWKTGKGLAQGILALGAVLIAMAGAANLTGGTKVKGFIAMAGALVLLLVPIKVLASMKLGELAKGVLPLIGLMAAMVAMARLTNGMKSVGLAGVVGAITALAAIGWLIGHTMNIEQLIIGFGSIVAVLGLISIFLNQVSKLGYSQIEGAKKILLAITAMIAVVAGSILLLSYLEVPWEMVAAFTVGLAAMALGISKALPLLGALDPKIAAKAVAILAIVAIAMAAIMGLVAEIVGMSFENFANHIAMVGSYLGLFSEMIQGIDTTGIETASDTLKSLSLTLVLIGAMDYGDVDTFRTNLTRSGASLKLFALMTAGIDTEKLKSVSLALREVATNFSGFPEISDVSTSIANIGGAIKLYAESMNGVDLSTAPDATALKTVFDSLKSAIPNDENLTDVAGYADNGKGEELTNFAIGLTNIATAVGSFSEQVKDLDFTNIQNATDALTAIASLDTGVSTTSVTHIGPFAKEVSEQKESLSTFSEDIVSLGTALKDFGDNISTVDAEKLKTGTNVLVKIAEMNEKLPKTGGVSQWLTGTQSLANFSACLKLLGAGARDFNDSIFGGEHEFDAAKVKAAGDAIKVIGDINSKLPKAGGISSWFTGDESLGAFGNNLKTLGTGVAEFASAMGGTTIGQNVEDGIGVIDSLASIQIRLGEVDTWYDLSTFGAYITSLATNASDANNTLTGITWTDTTPFISFINAMADTQVQLSSVTTGKSLSELGREIKTMFDEIYKFTQGGLFGGDTGKLEELTNSVTAIFDAIGPALSEDRSLSFENVGWNLAMGLAKGIKEGGSEVINAAANVVYDAIIAANKAADAHSPSRVFEQLGGFMDLGLVEGLYGSQDKVGEASEEMVNAAIEKAGIMMGAISAALADSLDLQPTITPVLDLSQIAAAGPTLDSMFAGYGLNLSNALSRAAAATGASGPIGVIVQNPVDLVGIQDSISNLQVEMGNLQTAISNMKLVLDTGVVAGAITDQVDQNLSRKGLYESRRN